MGTSGVVGTGALFGALGAALLVGLVPAPARAQPATAAPAAAEGATEKGRAAYARGVGLARAEQWGEALAAFEEAARYRDAPLVQLNIAYTQRALGHYVAARRAAEKVLSDTSGLAPSQVEETRAYLGEFEKLLVHLDVTLDPATATLTVDGRPLLPASEAGKPVLLASLSPSGEGTSPGREAFTLVLDPGLHLIRASRPGHEDAMVQRSYRAGEATSLALHLDTLPARVAIKSEPGAAIVRVNGREVGLAPIEVERPAGVYSVEIAQDTFETYKATLDLHAGQRADLTAKLVPYRAPLYKKWWFWTGAVVVIAGGAVATYALTRPAPQPPPYDGGSTNWVVPPKALHPSIGPSGFIHPFLSW